MFTTQNHLHCRQSAQSGFGMVEVLVSLIILMIGLLGLAGLMMQSQRSEMESYQRVQAVILLQDIAARINANRNVASCYVFTAASSGTPFLGVFATATPPPCVAGTAAQQLQATQDLTAWSNLLNGAAEIAGGSNAGAMSGAHGCISYNAASELIHPVTGATISGTGIYTVSAAWQGLGSTFANTVDLCGKDQYGNENQRRIATLTFVIASLL